jgi:hypothetical protein
VSGRTSYHALGDEASALSEREVTICGVSWAKFELCMNKIRRILSSLQRAERVVILYFCVRIRVRGNANNARLALPLVANQNQKFPYQSI